MSQDTSFAEKLRSLSFPRKLGASERQPVIDERDGTVGGYHDVRWDGSQDAHVLLKPLARKTVIGDSEGEILNG